MLRPVPLLACISIIAFAAFVNGLKLQGQSEAGQAAELRADIAKLKNEIDLLQAEWYKLNYPLRLQKLAEDNLALKPAKSEQIIGLNEGDWAAAITSFEMLSSFTASIDTSPAHGSPPTVIPKPRRAPSSIDSLFNRGNQP